jgi:uncharacterized small protein (DUF1192 family)
MDKFLEALRTLSLSDFLRILVLLAPVVAFIWAAFAWAYKSRLESLAASLKLHQEDLALRVAQEKKTQADGYDTRIARLQDEIRRLKAELNVRINEVAPLREDFRKLHELATDPTANRNAIWALWRELDDKYFHPKPTSSTIQP